VAKRSGLLTIAEMTRSHRLGVQAMRRGYRTARRFGPEIGAQLIGRRSNECRYRGLRAVFKSASAGNSHLNVTVLMLDRIDVVIGAFGKKSGSYDIWVLTIDRRQVCRWRSHRGQVQIDRSTFKRHGRSLGHRSVGRRTDRKKVRTRGTPEALR